MEDTIQLKSRRGLKNYLKKMKRPNGEDSKSFLLKTEIPSYKAGYTQDKKFYVDPAGGPLITEGEILKEAESKVKSINYEYKIGCIITFE